MSLRVQVTEDGSHTLFWEEKGEHYHSVHGSLQESRKVYIETAFLPALRAVKAESLPCLRVFEMGFGTGLNALLCLLEAGKHGIRTEYVSVEAFPLEEKLWRQLNFSRQLSLPGNALFESLHLQPFDAKPHAVAESFDLVKIKGRMQDLELPRTYFHAVFYDAFAPAVQPELWEEGIFSKLRQAAAHPCYLSSYCAQGRFRRALSAAGFQVEKLPGPAGKREITRAYAP